MRAEGLEPSTQGLKEYQSGDRFLCLFLGNFDNLTRFWRCMTIHEHPRITKEYRKVPGKHNTQLGTFPEFLMAKYSDKTVMDRRPLDSLQKH